MASINLEKLLEPVSDAAPAGANLEYDAAFLALERLAAGKPEQQMGEVIRAAEPPDWMAVVREGTELLARSKDLRIAVLVARGLTHLYGFPGLDDGLALVLGLLDRYFVTVHPELDPSDGNDPTMRITAIAGLGAPAELMALRSRPLVVSRAFGPITLRDVIAAASSSNSGDGAKSETMNIDAAFQDVEFADHEAAAKSIESAAARLSAIESVFQREHAGHGPELDGLTDVLRQARFGVVARFERRVAAAQPAESPANEAGAAAFGAPRGANPSGTGFSAEIRSRADVLRALDKICDYYAEFEPSSPLPLLLQRGKRLVSKSFLDIMRDMAPDGVSQVENIAGKADA